MTNTSWPDPARPGVPLNPERDGWHWLDMGSGKPSACSWFAGFWWHPIFFDSAGMPDAAASLGWRYLGPCLTPAEVAAREAAAWCAGSDAAAALCQKSYALSGHQLAACIACLTPPAGTGALSSALDRVRREALEEAARIADSVGRPAGASDGATYIPGTSGDAARAIRARAEKGPTDAG